MLGWVRADFLTSHAHSLMPILICNLCMHDESNVARTLGIMSHAQNGMPIQSAEHNDALAERIRASNNVTTNLNNFIISLHDG